MRVYRLSLSKSLLGKLYKEIQLYPFTPKFLHFLEPGDERKCVEFLLWQIILKTDHFTNIFSSPNNLHFAPTGTYVPLTVVADLLKTIISRRQLYQKVNGLPVIPFDRFLA